MSTAFRKEKPSDEQQSKSQEAATIIEEQGRRITDNGDGSLSSTLERGNVIGAREQEEGNEAPLSADLIDDSTEVLATRLDEAQRAFAIVTNTKKSEIVNRSVLSSVNVSSAAAEEIPRHVRKFTGDYDYYAPDGSRIKKLAAASRGDIAYCTLPAGKISSPVQHKTVEELWYVKSGKGELWLKGNEVEGNPDQVIALEENVTLFIPPGTPFQFRNIGEAQLDIVMTTMPCWPGPDEAIKVQEGLWKPSEEPDK